MLEILGAKREQSVRGVQKQHKTMIKLYLVYKIDKNGLLKCLSISKVGEKVYKLQKKRGRHPNDPVREFRRRGIWLD